MGRLTHIDGRGKARMVDVTPKDPTHRRAIARGRYAIVGNGRSFYHPVFIDDLVQARLLVVQTGGGAATAQALESGLLATVPREELLALLRRSLGLARLQDIMRGTVRLTSMVFIILLGASVFSLVFRGVDGDRWVETLLAQLPGGEAEIEIVSVRYG